MALLLADLGVVKSHRLLHVRRESLFGKPVPHPECRTGFPHRFVSIEDARGFWQSLFTWYNHEHHHAGLGLMDARDDPSWPSSAYLSASPEGSGCLVIGSFRALRTQTTQTADAACRGLDQQALFKGKTL